MNHLVLRNGWWVVSCRRCGLELGRRRAHASVDPPTLDQPCPACGPASAPASGSGLGGLVGVSGRIAGGWRRFAGGCDPGSGVELNRIGSWRLQRLVRGPVGDDRWHRRRVLEATP